MSQADPFAALGLSPEEGMELVEEFLAESRDQLSEAEPTLLDLEAIARDTGRLDEELVNRAFRAFHSLKGSAAVLGFEQLVAVTHTSESVLDHFRATKAPPLPEHISALCRAIDLCDAALDAIERDCSDRAIAPQVPAMTSLLDGLLLRLRSGDEAPPGR